MALVLNGSSDTITGLQINSANIVDGSIVNADINASAAIASTKLSGISAGITHANTWYLTTAFTGNADPMINWSTYDLAGAGNLGTSMTESSGVWTFPVTGFWKVEMSAYGYGSGTNSYAIYSTISTNSGSSYNNSSLRRSYSNIPSISGTWYSTSYQTYIYDVTNVSTTRLKVVMEGNPNNIDAGGTFVRFIRLAST